MAGMRPLFALCNFWSQPNSPCNIASSLHSLCSKSLYTLRIPATTAHIPPPYLPSVGRTVSISSVNARWARWRECALRSATRGHNRIPLAMSQARHIQCAVNRSIRCTVYTQTCQCPYPHNLPSPEDAPPSHQYAQWRECALRSPRATTVFPPCDVASYTHAMCSKSQYTLYSIYSNLPMPTSPQPTFSGGRPISPIHAGWARWGECAIRSPRETLGHNRIPLAMSPATYTQSMCSKSQYTLY
jgi:hypothetical protein